MEAWLAWDWIQHPKFDQQIYCVCLNLQSHINWVFYWSLWILTESKLTLEINFILPKLILLTAPNSKVAEL